VQHVGYRAQLAGAVLVRDVEQAALGLFQQLGYRTLKREDLVLNIARRRQEPAHERVLLDDLRVVADVARRGDQVRQRVDVRGAARVLEAALLRQLLADRQDVDRLGVGLLLQADHRLEDQAVRLAVEVLGPELDVDQERIERLLRQQDRTEDRRLGLEVLGWDLGA
jgi:hypothetical protein